MGRPRDEERKHLTGRQKRFCEEFLKDYCVKQAMLRAGYSHKMATRAATEQMANPGIKAYLAELAAPLKRDCKLTAERVLEEFRRIAFTDITSFYKWSDEHQRYVPKLPSELTEEQKSAVLSYSPIRGYRLHSKAKALGMLALHFKILTEPMANVNNIVMMPTITLGKKELEFNIGQPAPPLELPPPG